MTPEELEFQIQKYNRLNKEYKLPNKLELQNEDILIWTGKGFEIKIISNHDLGYLYGVAYGMYLQLLF